MLLAGRLVMSRPGAAPFTANDVFYAVVVGLIVGTLMSIVSLVIAPNIAVPALGAQLPGALTPPRVEPATEAAMRPKVRCMALAPHAAEAIFTALRTVK